MPNPDPLHVVVDELPRFRRLRRPLTAPPPTPTPRLHLPLRRSRKQQHLPVVANASIRRFGYLRRLNAVIAGVFVFYGRGALVAGPTATTRQPATGSILAGCRGDAGGGQQTVVETWLVTVTTTDMLRGSGGHDPQGGPCALPLARCRKDWGTSAATLGRPQTAARAQSTVSKGRTFDTGAAPTVLDNFRVRRNRRS